MFHLTLTLTLPQRQAVFYALAQPLGRGVRGERLYFAIRHDFIVALRKTD